MDPRIMQLLSQILSGGGGSAPYGLTGGQPGQTYPTGANPNSPEAMGNNAERMDMRGMHRAMYGGGMAGQAAGAGMPPGVMGPGGPPDSMPGPMPGTDTIPQSGIEPSSGGDMTYPVTSDYGGGTNLRPAAPIDPSMIMQMLMSGAQSPVPGGDMPMPPAPPPDAVTTVPRRFQPPKPNPGKLKTKKNPPSDTFPGEGGTSEKAPRKYAPPSTKNQPKTTKPKKERSAKAKLADDIEERDRRKDTEQDE